MKRFLLLAGVMAGVAGASFAGTICPAGSGSNPFLHSPDAANTGCNVVITIAATGGASTVVVDSIPYEESEDVLIGVKNNSSTPISTLAVSGATGSGIFGFDGDGICTFTFVGSTYCTAAQTAGTDPGDYQGPTSTFSNFATGDKGTVNFSPAIAANGGTSYFSLEGIPTANLTVSTGGTPPPTVPAPSSITMLAVGFAMILLVQARRKFAHNN